MQQWRLFDVHFLHVSRVWDRIIDPIIIIISLGIFTPGIQLLDHCDPP